MNALKHGIPIECYRGPPSARSICGGAGDGRRRGSLGGERADVLVVGTRESMPSKGSPPRKPDYWDFGRGDGRRRGWLCLADARERRWTRAGGARVLGGAATLPLFRSNGIRSRQSKTSMERFCWAWPMEVIARRGRWLGGRQTTTYERPTAIL